MNLSKYRKGAVAALTAGLVAATQALPLTDTEVGWVTVILAMLGAGGVIAVKNTTPPQG